MLIAAFALLGLAVGSFLNVCIDRLPHGQSLVSPASHCSSCGRKLRISDLIPLLSYLWIRGRCRYCRAQLPLRIPAVEAITGALFALLLWHYGIGLQLAVLLLYSCILLVIFVIDLETQLVLDVVTFPAMALALGAAFLPPGPGIKSALLGGGIGLAAMAVPFLVYRSGMGMGDIKLGALIGLMAGSPAIAVALFLAVTSGGIVAGTLLATKARGRRDAIPFGPFLAAAAMVGLLWGQQIWRWYI